MGRTVQIVERPGTELVHVALIVPQDTLHGQRITGAGRLEHRPGQQLPPTESRLLHFIRFFVLDNVALIICQINHAIRTLRKIETVRYHDYRFMIFFAKTFNQRE